MMRTRIRRAWLALILPLLLGATAPVPAPDVDSSYSVRLTMRILNPVNPEVMNGRFQKAKILKQTAKWTEVEFTLFPLAEEDPVEANWNWRTDDAGMAADLKPGLTCNWDEPMKRDLTAALKADGIDVEMLSDKALVEKVSRWLLTRSKYNNKMFDTWFVDFSSGKPEVFKGLEKPFEAAKGDPAWSVQEQFERELLGRQMFENRTCGSCTSYGILQATVMKALGIPTRIIELTPIVDSNDPKQIEMVSRGIQHHRVRVTIIDGLPAGGFCNHTMNEVYVGKRWVRLNYTKLGQPILDAQCYGLTVHTNTLRDWSEVNYAATWGKRYALGERDEVSNTSNPYRAIELSDHFPGNAKIDNPEINEVKIATVTKAYFKNGNLMLRLKPEPFNWDWHKLKSFLRQAPKQFELTAPGHETVSATATTGSSTDSTKGIFDAYLAVEEPALARLADGVEYELVMPRDESGFGWTAEGKIVVQKRN
jgi:hypothetical protein